MSNHVIISRKNKLTETELKALIAAAFQFNYGRNPALTRAYKKLKAAHALYLDKKNASPSPLAREAKPADIFAGLR